MTIYNASRQGLRISTKTNIAKLLLSKEPEFDFEVSTNYLTMTGLKIFQEIAYETFKLLPEKIKKIKCQELFTDPPFKAKLSLFQGSILRSRMQGKL